MILHRVRQRWMRRAITFMRWSRVAAYMCVAFAGLFAVAYPPTSIAVATGSGHIVQIAWAILMLISAGFCAYGALADRWIGEYVGLVPLGFAAAAFGISSLSRGTVGTAGGLFLVGFFWMIVSRWQEIALLRAEADRSAHAQNAATASADRTGARE